MTRRQTGPIAAGGFLVLAAIGLIDTLALLPSVLTDSLSLSEVWTSIAEAGDLAPVLVGPVLWGLLCAALAAWHLRASRRTSAVSISAVASIGLGALGTLHQGAALGMNLWLSNHLPPFEGGSTAVGSALSLFGAVAIIAGLIVLAVGARRRRERESAAA